ncbi:MAG TPA: HDOD domain-containing protein [Opitutaceae bacterium]|nr:HDOD domain-containing protein [Opitutaceae bacterium]
MLSITDEKFAAAAEKLPSTPRIFERINVALRNPDVEIEDLARILKLDAALSARLLRVANSAAAGGSAPAVDLAEAIQRTGFREVFRVVGVAMTAQLYVSGLPMYGVGGTELWENSVATALAMEKLAAVAGEDVRLGYTLGLLRSVGRLLLQRLAAGQVCAPLAGRKETGALVLAWETDTFGFTSAAATRRLFKLWKFSADLGGPVEHHLQPEADPARARLTALLHVAGYIANALGHGLVIENELWSLTPQILAQAGLSAAEAEACQVSIAEELARMTSEGMPE